MPSVGRPVRNIAGSGAGAPGEYTDLGPPDRISALGRRASISASGRCHGTISEYTWHSRTRRAMSCAYCAPKSTTRTRSPVPASSVVPLRGSWAPDGAWLVTRRGYGRAGGRLEPLRAPGTAGAGRGSGRAGTGSDQGRDGEVGTAPGRTPTGCPAAQDVDTRSGAAAPTAVRVPVQVRSRQ